MTRFLLVGGELSSGNRGVDAISLGTIRCLRDFFPDAEFAIIGFTSPKDDLMTYQIDLDDNQIEVVEARTAFRKGALLALRTRLIRGMSHNVALKYFWWADVIIDVSGGDGFGDTYGIKVLLRHSIGKLVGLHLGKPYAIFPQTMGPFRSRVARQLARYLLGKADLLCVREQFSEKIIRNVLGESANVFCLADMAFLMQETDVLTAPYLYDELPDTKTPIGFNVSGFLWYREQEVPRADGTTFSYRKVCVEAVRRLVMETGQPVVLIPHVFSESSVASDVRACQEVYTQLQDLGGKVIQLNRNYSAPEIKAIIAQCEFFVGARMHACIAALSTGTPVVPIAYSHKYSGILQRFGIQDWVIDPEYFSEERAIELVLSGYEHREEIRRYIITNLPLVKSEAMRAGQLVKDIVS